MGLGHGTPVGHLGRQAQSGTWSLLLPPVQMSSERPTGCGPGPARRIRHVLWAADFPWVPDHSPGSQRLCMFSKQPSPAPPAHAEVLPSRLARSLHLAVPPLLISLSESLTLSVPQTEVCPREVTSRGSGPGKRALLLPASQGRRLQPPGHQDVGGAHQHPCKSDLRKL